MNEFNPNCGKCGMLNSRGFCSLTACRYPSNVIAVQPVNVPFVPKPTTNADRIRAMTDEELAHFMARVCPPGGKCNEDGNCFACRRDWLKAPVEEVQK